MSQSEQVDYSVSTTRCDNSAVGAEAHRSDPVGVPEEALHELLGGRLLLLSPTL